MEQEQSKRSQNLSKKTPKKDKTQGDAKTRSRSLKKVSNVHQVETAKDSKYPKLDIWLRSRLKEFKDNQEENVFVVQKENVNKKRKKSPKKPIQTSDISSIKQATLDKFLRTKSKKTLVRSESSDSCELPSFKTPKRDNKTKSQQINKYGISLPSVEEMLQDKKDLEIYRNQLDSFKPMRDDLSFVFLASTSDSQKSEECEQILDCKHLTSQKLARLFRKHRTHLSDILQGKIYNERHARFHDINTKPFTLTTRDLTYNTSMIVFSFEQIELLLNLLTKEFDEEDNLTQYFFKVLLPVLCLRIFMDTHAMGYEEATQYLDTRPIEDV